MDIIPSLASSRLCPRTQGLLFLLLSNMDFITENILLIITFVGSAILLAFPSLSKSKNSGLSPAEVVIQVNDKDAQLVAENIAQQLENRISFRRAMKSCMSRTMKSGALGVKTSVSGRLGGADMARTEFYSEGTIPLQTLRADIDYGFAEADTTYGKVGVKVWIYKGEVLPKKAVEGSDK